MGTEYCVIIPATGMVNMPTSISAGVGSSLHAYAAFFVDAKLQASSTIRTARIGMTCSFHFMLFPPLFSTTQNDMANYRTKAVLQDPQRAYV